MNIKNVLTTIAISALTTVGVIVGYDKLDDKDNLNSNQITIPANYKYAGLFDSNGTPSAGPTDFTQAAVAASPTVVHIKVKTNPKQVSNSLPRQKNPFSDFFGSDELFEQFFGNGTNRQRMLPQMASGSGVIVSEDGYIITNNHVVAGADEVSVIMSNKKTYTAKVIGADPSYDLAVLKVNLSKLPFMLYGNSDEVKIGQWVLAIGFPLNLETTVTAGIISAKGRALGLNKDKTGNKAMAVESFIQTDAAVNQGNSGGALINTNGQLIGINSAIASLTGFYAGYSYAIPVNIVKKVVDDLIKYGSVQRGFLGAQFIDAAGLNDEEKKLRQIPLSADGIYITDVTVNGAANAAGIKKGDIIRKVNDVTIESGSDLQEQLSRFKPGDKVNVTYNRNGTQNTVGVTLKNNSGNFNIVKADEMVDKLGADLVTLDNKKAREYGIDGGVIVKKINKGAINDQTRMRDGYIITKANGKTVKSVEELRGVIGSLKEVKVEGIYPGYNEIFEYPLSLDESASAEEE